MKLSTEHLVTLGHRYALFYVFMQTRDRPVLGVTHTRIGHRPFVAMALALLVMTASCSPVHLEAVNTQRSRSTCEAAYDIASAATTRASDTQYPRSVRYLAAAQASEQWTSVAAHCSQRFAEGTLRSAQTRWQQSALAKLLGGTTDSYVSVSAALNALSATDEDSAAWSAMALA